jgi:small subunit ribosomal protein S17
MTFFDMTKEQTQPSMLRSVKAPVFRGTVVSDRMEKTVVVSVETLKTHPKYRKKYRSTRRFQVHDPENRHKIGETVEFRECPPRSRHKRHEVISSERI